MDKVRRNERMAAMINVLAGRPNKIVTLNSFSELFGTAKSTLSEDVNLLQNVVNTFDLGQVETVAGAAGGVRYRPTVSPEKARETILRICGELSGTARLLPGGFLYTADILSDPETVSQMGEIIATAYFDAEPDFVLTMETGGIPVAFATAKALGTQLVIAKRSSQAYEGSAVNISYVSGNGGIETMSLSRRAVRENQRALIVDDFLKGGGTARGMIGLMREFNVEVAGMAFVIATKMPEKKQIFGEKALMTLEITAGEPQEAIVRPADWLG